MLSILVWMACTPTDTGSVKPEETACTPSPWFADGDGDGFGAAQFDACAAPVGYIAEGGDCDDTNAAIHPGAADECDGLDGNCDGKVDEDAVVSTWYVDADGDGYGKESIDSCRQPAGTVAVGDDCDDADDLRHPGAVESDCADPVDYNCDGSVTWADEDGDGWAACEECDDTRSDTFPGADEWCEGTDQDCDGEIDEDAEDATRWYDDGDGDGFGSGSGWLACDGEVDNADDCDDTNAETFPGADERCDEVDNDCDGTTDADAIDEPTWYTDEDGDGFGAGAPYQACVGEVANADDCDDSDPAVSPAGVEVCGGGDEDCDGSIDEDVGGTWYADSDGDGFGAGEAYVACVGGVENADDCDDGSSAIHPGATERCNNADDDCDGTVDVGAFDETTWFPDVDGDGSGAGDAYVACAGDAETDDDCDDDDPTVSPSGVEVCDGIDQDCDAVVDDGVGWDWYVDGDGDGFGGSTRETTCSETPPTGYTATYADCDDTQDQVYPGAVEVCDGMRNDCSITAWDETGLVTWEAPDGTWTDQTASWAGIWSPSSTLELPGEGTTHVCSGTWYVTLTVPAGASTTLRGHGDGVVLDAGYDGSNVALVDGSASVVIEDLTLDKGAADHGGSVYNPGGVVRLDGVAVSRAYSTNEDGGNGVCIYSEGGSVELVDTSFSSCNGSGADSGRLGGLLGAIDADVVMERVTGSSLAAEMGGGVYWSSTSDATLLVSDSDLDGASAFADGGAFYIANNGTGLARLDGVEISDSSADYGAGIYATGTGAIELYNVGFDNNGADHHGAGVYVDDAPGLTMDVIRATKCDASYGAGVFFATDGAITNSRFFSNGSIYQPDYHGMGIAVGTGAVVSIEDTTFEDNLTVRTSAGLYVGSGADVTCTRCTFADNTIDQNGTCSGAGPTSPTCGGGAIYTLGDLRLVDSTITGTTMDLGSGPGGAVFVYNGSLVLERTILEGNQAPYGGGVFVYGTTATASVTMDSGSAIRDNTSSEWGGGVYLSGGTLSCSDTEGTGTDLTGNVGGAVYLDSSTGNTATVSACDLGESGTADDNTSASGSPTCDVYATATGWYTYGDDATFSCTAGGCL